MDVELEEQSIGREFGGRYRIEAEIGRGGIGVVYRVTDIKLGRPAALKLLRSDAVAPAQRARFEREVKALAALKHPNIVAILDGGVSEAQQYLVMELLEGQSLAQALGGRAVPPDRARFLMRELLSALGYVHACGLVHRDLKPGNVFVQRLPDGGEQIKLLDFGLAKFIDREPGGDTTTVTRSGDVFGTPAYMPPEQWTGQAVDARADVYSAAVVLFEMIAGRKPFAGEGQDLLRRQLVETAPLLHEVCPDRVALPELERLLQRALAMQPADRQATAIELAAELEAVPEPWLYTGRDATGERRAAALAVRAALDIATAPTLEQRPAAAVVAPRSAGRVVTRRSPFIAAARALRELLRRVVLAGAWALAAVSLLVIAIAVAIIYIAHSPDHVEQRAALEQALPPLRDAVARGAEVAKNAVDHAVSNATERVSAQWLPQERAVERRDPCDARAHMLRARASSERGAWNEATAQYAQAFACDRDSRADPRMLQDLLRAVARDASSSTRATELVREAYGRDARDAVTRARSQARAPAQRARLDRLARTLSP
jgi:serine/threonine-protein kinase